LFQGEEDFIQHKKEDMRQDEFNPPAKKMLFDVEDMLMKGYEEEIESLKEYVLRLESKLGIVVREMPPRKRQRGFDMESEITEEATDKTNKKEKNMDDLLIDIERLENTAEYYKQAYERELQTNKSLNETLSSLQPRPIEMPSSSFAELFKENQNLRRILDENLEQLQTEKKQHLIQAERIKMLEARVLELQDAFEESNKNKE
jgi:hypothetical protein